SASAASCTRNGFTELITRASGIASRDFIACSIHAKQRCLWQDREPKSCQRKIESLRAASKILPCPIMVGASHAVLVESGARNDLYGPDADSRRCQGSNEWPSQFRSGLGHTHAIEWRSRTHWQGKAQ